MYQGLHKISADLVLCVFCNNTYTLPGERFTLNAPYYITYLIFYKRTIHPGTRITF